MTDNTLNIFGGGDLGRQGYWLLKSASPRVSFDSVCIYDDVLAANPPQEWEGLPVGGSMAFDAWRGTEISGVSVIGLGYRHLPIRQSMLHQLTAHGASVPNLVHPSVILADDALQPPDPGSPTSSVSLYPGVVIDFRVRIASGAVINVGARVCHDSSIGECSFIGPGVTVCGGVILGQRCFVGAGSTLRNGISVGDDARIAMGSVVKADVKAGQAVAGNPARVVASLSL